MTTDELRDWHARDAGWVNTGEQRKCVDYRMLDLWRRNDASGEHSVLGHPFPPTRDGAASAMPAGVSVRVSLFRTLDEWACVVMWNGMRLCATGDNEIHVRYEAAKLAKEAMKP